MTGQSAMPNAATGTANQVGTITWRETTTRVPARLGTGFGIDFVVVGQPKSQNVALEARWSHPPPGLRNPQTRQVHLTSINRTTVPIGATRLESYTFDNDWEMVPGPWTVEIWWGERKLLSQTFTVYKP